VSANGVTRLSNRSRQHIPSLVDFGGVPTLLEWHFAFSENEKIAMKRERTSVQTTQPFLNWSMVTICSYGVGGTGLFPTPLA
jgi:hypothetical protein